MLKYREYSGHRMEVHYEKQESIGFTHIDHRISRVSHFISLCLVVYGRMGISDVESSALIFSGIYGVNLYTSNH
jgi:hypothetical protein